jgi:fibronectin-binding autotransporter adhesin
MNANQINSRQDTIGCWSYLPRIEKIGAILALLLALMLPASAAQRNWSATPTSNNWNNGANWDTLPAPPSDGLVFGASTITNLNNDFTAGSVFTNITFPASTSLYTISGNAITLGGNIVNSSANLQTINLNMAMTTNRTVTANSGGSDMNLGGAVSGAFSLLKGGNGTLTISGNNTCSTIQINAGTLKLGAVNTLPTSGSLVVAGTTATVCEVNGCSQIVGALTIAGTGSATIQDSVGGAVLKLGGAVTQNSTGEPGTISVPLDLNGAYRIFNIQNATNSGVTVTAAITNSTATAGITKNGSGTLILAGTNSYNGNTTINAGTLKINVACLSSSASVSISNTAVLNLNFIGTNVVSALLTNGIALAAGVYNSTSLPGLITGSGALQVLAPASAGIWQGLGTDNYWSDGTNWDNDVVPVFPIGLTFTGSARLTPTNNLTGITVNGITFDSAAGAFTIAGNAITLGGNIGFNGNPASVITQTINLNLAPTAAQMILTQTNGNITLGGVISGTNFLFKQNVGVLTLSGQNIFTGQTQIRQGTLVVGVDNALYPSNSINLNPTAGYTSVFDLNGHTVSLTPIVAGLGGATATAVFTNSGSSGKLIMTSTNFSMNSGAATTATVAMALDLNGVNQNFTINDAAQTMTVTKGIINTSGTAGLIKNGSGTVVLTATNTYNGNTAINAGTLELNVACLSSTASVSISNTAVLNLNFNATNTVGALYTNGVALAAGVYNSASLPGLITGSGALSVGPATPPTAPVILAPYRDGLGNVVIQTVTQIGYNYLLLSTTNLNPPVAWITNSTTIGTGGTITNLVPISNIHPNQFFRYLVQ